MLLYISHNKIYLYLVKKKKEIIEEVDTSLFFENGDIRSVKECIEILKSIFQKNKIVGGLLKLDVDILYNNITTCDIMALYKMVIKPFDCGEITFTTIESLLKNIKDYSKLIYYDGETFTSFYSKKKSKDIKTFSKDSIIIGTDYIDYIHYAEKNILWKKYKSKFTKV